MLLIPAGGSSAKTYYSVHEQPILHIVDSNERTKSFLSQILQRNLLGGFEVCRRILQEG